VGAALLGYGLPAHRVEESVLRLARAFGRSAAVFGLPTALIITLHGPSGADLQLVRAEPGTIDLARLDELHRVVARVEQNLLDAHTAEQEVATILRAAPAHPRAFDLFAAGLVGFGGSLMLGSSPDEAAWAGALAVGVGMLIALGRARPALARVLPLCAAVATTLSTSALSHMKMLDHPLAVAMASQFLLLPGLMLTLAMTELATGHLVSGTARCMGACVVFLQLGLGALLGARFGELSQSTFVPLSAPPLAAAGVGAFLLASGFAVVLRVRRRDIPQTYASAGLAFLLCQGVGSWQGTEIGALIAACAVTLYGHAFARRRDRPSSTLTLPGVTMLVPGSLGLMSVSAAAMSDPTRAFAIGFQLLMVLVALSSGILFAAAVLPPRTGV
jgi:uncharacterized membrane protein YjjP (DUF1212 family)